jgi:spermidine/putrescine transport system substrate-binding protein
MDARGGAMLAGRSIADEPMTRGTPSLPGGLSRRRALRRATAGVAAFATGPWVAARALSSSGELNILSWADQVTDPVLAKFTERTGIRVTVTNFAGEEDQLEKLTAAGANFDLCQPALHRAPAFRETGRLAPFDMDRLPNAANLIPSIMTASADLWTWEDGLHYLPHCWGSEAIAWRTDLTSLTYADLSYGTLWNEAYRGKVQGRPHSLLLGIGLWLDAIGKLPTNRLRDVFTDEATMRSIYDQILATAIEKRPWIGQFWDTAERARMGFLEKGCVIGQTWDGPAADLQREGKPVGYMAPREGAIAWVDGWAMTSTAVNVEQAYEFLNFLMTPETNALTAETSRYNPTVVGAEAQMSEGARKVFVEAYPEDALQRLWFRPPEPPWFTRLRVQYAEKFRSA